MFSETEKGLHIISCCRLEKSFYCQRLTRLQQALEKYRSELVNRKGVIFHNDKARSRTRLTTQKKMQRTLMGNSDTSVVYSRSYTIRLLLVSVSAELRH